MCARVSAFAAPVSVLSDDRRYLRCWCLARSRAFSGRACGDRRAAAAERAVRAPPASDAADAGGGAAASFVDGDDDDGALADDVTFDDDTAMVPLAD